MEKASDNNPTKLSKMLQKALSIGHSAAPFSPVRDFHHRRTASTVNRGFFFSGPMTPLLPSAARARRRTKNAVVFAEPTSPKVSCIGQIKLAKSSKCPETKNRERKKLKPASSCQGKGNWSKLKRLFSMGSRKPNYTAVSAAREPPPISAVEAVTAPSLCKMKKFASSRETLAGYDWTVEIKREESRSDHRRVYSSDDKETMIPCAVSTPLTLCSRQKSEVNLWKRRTMDRPKPLQVKATY
ncbi:hypothetical protein N665_0046s0053 [Sinapis alba]|nr:hypothetical protein N665_0046s0053 [Sinapis alba]